MNGQGVALIHLFKAFVETNASQSKDSNRTLNNLVSLKI